MRDSGKQKKWLKVLEKTPELLVKGKTSRELSDVNDLVENGFLVVSEEYMSWVDAEEEKGIVGTLEGEPGTSEARAEVQARRTRRLERQVRGLRSRLAEERRRVRSLEETNRSLANRLERIQASRGWRLLNRLARVRARMPFRRATSGK
jgi:predicted RNase H-like nuclease (RuvC/YqgF family)